MYSVVIVDDESGACNMIKGFIEANAPDFSVSQCFLSAGDALSYLLSNKCDVVITDIKMPVMDGIELTRRLRENDVNSKIIFLSGYGDFEYAKKAIEYGVFNYILKPIDFSELAQTLGRIKDLLDSTRESHDSRNDFFLKMFTSLSKDDTELKKEFLRLNFPFGLEQFKGHIFRLKIENYEKYIKEKWNYDSDKMDDAILNIIKMSVRNSYVFQIYHDHNTILFVVICREDADLFTKIRTALKSILPFAFNLQKVYGFASFDEALQCNNLDNGDLYQEKNAAGDDLIVKIKEYLKQNYNKNIYLSDLGVIFNMNSVYLARIFKQQTGVSPYEYHLSERMNKAIELLINGNKVEYIAKVLGYADKRCFFRNFKHYTGYSPSEYKEKMLKIDDEQF